MVGIKKVNEQLKRTKKNMKAFADYLVETFFDIFIPRRNQKYKYNSIFALLVKLKKKKFSLTKANKGVF